MHTRLPVILAAAGLTFVAACGKDDKKGGGAGPSTVASLTVTSAVAEGGATNARTFAVSTNYQIPPNTAPATPLAVKMQLKNDKDEVVWEREIPGNEAAFEVPLSGAEGPYVLTAIPSTLGIAAEREAKPWELHFSLDFTAPRLGVDTQLAPNADDTALALEARVAVTDATSVTCDDLEVKLPAPHEPKKAALKKQEGDPSAAEQIFAIETLALEYGTTLNLAVVARCHDAAGNVTELYQPVEIAPRDYNLAAAPDAELAGSVYYVKPGDLTLKLDLVDKQTGRNLPPAAVDAEKELLRAYVTATAPATLADLGPDRHVIWAQPFESAIVVDLPRDYEAEERIFVTVVRRDLFAGDEKILGTIPLDLYVDGIGPDLTVAVNTPPRDAVKDTELRVAATTTTAGAPLKSEEIEVSSDGTTWSKIASTRMGGDLVFGYPYDAEKSFHARVRATDLSGNATVVDVNALLVKRTGAIPALANTERDACRIAGNAAGSKFAVTLASSFLCRKKAVDGQLSTSKYAVFAVQNRGGAVPTFYSTVSLPAGLGYQVWADGVRVATGRFEPPTVFALAAGKSRLVNFELNDAWLNAENLQIRFDVEADGPNSTSNACYANATPYAPVDLPAGARADAAFACDGDRIVD